MTDYAISYANLNAIENGLRAISDDLGTLNDNLGVIDRSVDNVNSNVQIVYSQVDALARDFHDFVKLQKQENALMKAQQRIIQIRQELGKSSDTMMMSEDMQPVFFRRMTLGL